MHKYQFRFAVSTDVEAIVALVESAYRGEVSRQGWTTEADLLDGQRTDRNEVSSLLQQASSHILLCEQQGELLASVHLLNKKAHAYLGMFAVRPELQAKGIGRSVIEQAESIVFDEWHSPALRMTVISLRVELISWYQRRGYHLTGETAAFPYGDERFGLPRREDLEFIVLEKNNPNAAFRHSTPKL